MITNKERMESIKQDEIHRIKSSIAAKESSLADPLWASDGSAYHLECRLRMKAEIDFLKKLIKKIDKKQTIS